MLDVKKISRHFKARDRDYRAELGGIISYSCARSKAYSEAEPGSFLSRTVDKEPQMPIEMMIRKLRQHSELPNEDIGVLRSNDLLDLYDETAIRSG